VEKKNPLQGLVWFKLNDLSSSQNGQNSLIHNWCISGCWFTQAHHFVEDKLQIIGHDND
jgi:hypothetical protein